MQVLYILCKVMCKAFSVYSGGGVCPKSSHQLPRDYLPTPTLFRHLRCVCLVLFVIYFWPTTTKHNQTNLKGLFGKASYVKTGNTVLLILNSSQNMLWPLGYGVHCICEFNLLWQWVNKGFINHNEATGARLPLKEQGFVASLSFPWSHFL